MANIAEAKTLLEAATQDCKSAQEIANRAGKYAAAKSRAAALLDELNKLPALQKAPIAKDLEQVATKLDSATAKAEIDKKPDEAVRLLDEVQKQLDQLKIKSDLTASLNSPAPNPKFIKLLMKESGGTKMLDDLVAQMDDKTNRNVLEAAMEARFDVNFQQFLSQDGITVGKPPKQKTVHGTADQTAPDKSVKRIYEMLLKVPESDVLKNTKLTSIRRFQEDTGGAAYGGAEIDLNCGRSGSTTSSNQAAELCSPDYFPDGVDENCQPPDDAKKKEVQYFDWATLHEVGHAVDDKNQFMAKNQSKDEFGAWEEYKKDVTVPANAAQKKFNYDLTYITNRLLGITPPPAAAAKPADRDQDDWDQAKKDFDAWCNTVMGLRLWWDGEGCKRVAIDGRVYQLAYKTPEWVSYKLEARKRGIHGYQFRSPAEWFAELYAAYYLGMLKPDHPSVKDWLPKALK